MSVVLDRPGTPQASTARPRRRARVLVLQAAGTNCDAATAEACRLAGGAPEIVHLNALLRGERRLEDFGMLVIPGGFSYGDHLGAGSMLATVLRHRLLPDLRAFIAAGKPVLGICNGFQALARLGLLGPAGLAPNRAGKFQCTWVPLRVTAPECLFLRDIETLSLSIANGQGRILVPPDAVPLAPLRYIDNPNGSDGDIAGMCNEAGTVFGLMPHPERAVAGWQSPTGDIGGLRIFQNAVAYVKSL